MTDDGRLTGTLARIMLQKRFGFIRAGGHDYFVHEQDFADGSSFDTMSEGDHISFTANATPKGLRASNAVWEGART